MDRDPTTTRNQNAITKPQRDDNTGSNNSMNSILKNAEGARVKRRRLQSSAMSPNKTSHSIENPAAINRVDGKDDKTNFAKISRGDTEKRGILDAGVKKESQPIDPNSRKLSLGQGGVYVVSDFSESPSSSENLDPEDLTSDSAASNFLYATKFPRSQGSGSRSSIRLLCDLSEPHDLYGKNKNVDTVSLADLIGSPDLLETYQFNFNVQLPMFLSFLHESFASKNKKVVFVTGGSVFESADQKSLIRKKFNISEATAPLPHKFASHHTKMMVNLFENGDAEVVIMTANLTQLDICGLTQALWRSGRLSTGPTETSSGKRFRLDLLRYLSRYNLNATKRLIAILGKYDFSSVDVELVASAPGAYDVQESLSSGECYGYAKLRQVLERNDLLIKDTNKTHGILSQVTSLAYPYTSKKGETSSIFSHLLCPLMFEHWDRNLKPGARAFEQHQQAFDYTPKLIFPTKKDVFGSKLGYLSGAAIHFKYEGSAIHKAQYQQNIKSYLCKWGTKGDITGREGLTPHVKYYACDNGDNWDSLKWVMVGSHNLSKQAWGYPRANTNGKSMDVSSYELSVLIPQRDQKLRPTYKADTLPEKNGIPVRFPFILPPVSYDAEDSPWTAEGL